MVKKYSILVFAIFSLIIPSLSHSKTEQAIGDHFCKREVKSVKSQIKPKVLFLAGLPGAGKSSVKRTLSNLGLISFSEYLSIDSDEFIVQLDGYMKSMKVGRPLDAVNNNQDTAVRIRERALNCSKSARVNFIIDGTLVSHKKISAQIKQFKGMGYTPWILYVSVDSVEAWRRVKERQKQEGRTVDEGYFNFVVNTLPNSMENYKNNGVVIITVENSSNPAVLKEVFYPKNRPISAVNMPITQRNQGKLSEIFNKIMIQLNK